MKSNNSSNFFKSRINEIPVLICSNEDISPKPLVIFSHGFSGNKEFWKEYMKELAELGYYTVAIDNRLHGERNDEGFGSVISNDGKVDFYKVFEAIKLNAEDIIQVLDYFTKKAEIDKTRVAMVGISMGGFTTYRTVVIDNRIKVAIPIIASPVWGDLPKDTPINDNSEIIKMFNILSSKFNPSKYLDHFYPTALFMQAGSKDIHFDVDKLKKFYEDIKQYYINDPSKLKLIIFEGVKHEFTKEMWDNTKSWLNSYL